MKNKRVAIVGAGLAGLTAAYRLLKEGNCSIDVYESQPHVGGRVYSRKVLGHNVDFGGFLMYPWYDHAHALFADLGVANTLVRTPLDDIYYVLDHSGIALREQEIPFPVSDGLQIWSKSLFKIIPKSDLAVPDLVRFEGKTISQYLRSVLGDESHPSLYERFFDSVNQGYCYGPVTESKAAFMMPIVRQVKFHGDIRTTSFFPHGGRVLIDRLREEIIVMRGIIHTNTPITDIKHHTLFSNTQSFEHDAILFAQNVSSELYHNILPNVAIECWYTQFLTVAVQLPHTPVVGNTNRWGAVFYAPHEETSPQTLSVINLPSLYGNALDGCIMMNIVLRSKTEERMNRDVVALIVNQELQKLFPNTRNNTILEFVHWKHTMPVAQESFVQAVRNAQGKHDYYFVGDFLGAPSIETAIATGNHAAAHLLVNTAH